jgi:hypothetical protein
MFVIIIIADTSLKMTTRPNSYTLRVCNNTGLRCGICKNVQCLGCPFDDHSEAKTSFNPKQTLVVDWRYEAGVCKVPQGYKVHESAARAEMEGEEKITLDQCFASQFNSTSTLDDYHCQACARVVPCASLSHSLCRWPNRFLLVALKRFARRDLSDKIDIQVDYPLVWRGMVLVSVVCHLASRGGAGGHYVAYR